MDLAVPGESHKLHSGCAHRPVLPPDAGAIACDTGPMAVAETQLRTDGPITASSREYGLDWLRVFAFAVLIFYHSGMIFVRWDWHIKNPEKSEALEWVMLFFNRWRLPLLFFISGAGVWFSLRRRRLAEFAGERVRRLLVPLLFGMLVIVPPQIYFERLHRGATFSYGEFYPSVFEGVPYPQGSTSWHHLWFVAYILVYSLALIPAFAWLRSPAGTRFREGIASACEKPGVIYLINVPSILVGLALGPHWPTTHNLIADWANLTSCLITFLWGFILCSQARSLDLLTRRRREWLIGALLVTAGFYATRVGGVGGLVRELFSAYMGMLWIFTLVGYSRAWCTQGSATLRYATEAVYPFYIVHQTITVAMAYYLVEWNAGVPVKLAIAMAGTFSGSLAIFEIVRRVNWLRPFFGLKSRA